MALLGTKCLCPTRGKLPAPKACNQPRNSRREASRSGSAGRTPLGSDGSHRDEGQRMLAAGSVYGRFFWNRSCSSGGSMQFAWDDRPGRAKRHPEISSREPISFLKTVNRALCPLHFCFINIFREQFTISHLI